MRDPLTPQSLNIVDINHAECCSSLLLSDSSASTFLRLLKRGRSTTTYSLLVVEMGVLASSRVTFSSSSSGTCSGILVVSIVEKMDLAVSDALSGLWLLDAVGVFDSDPACFRRSSAALIRASSSSSWRFWANTDFLLQEHKSMPRLGVSRSVLLLDGLQSSVKTAVDLEEVVELLGPLLGNHSGRLSWTSSRTCKSLKEKRTTEVGPFLANWQGYVTPSLHCQRLPGGLTPLSISISRAEAWGGSRNICAGAFKQWCLCQDP